MDGFRHLTRQGALRLLIPACMALLVSAIVTQAVSAQTPKTTPEAAPAGPLELIQVTAKRRAVSTFETAQPVTVVTESALRKGMPKVTADALRGTAGVFVQQTTPGQGNAIIRGLKGSEVLHLVDGVRLNNALFRNAPNQYLALVDPQLLSGIEVVRGPASTLYGADAMGGVVQFLTRKPQFDQSISGGGSLIVGSVDESVAVSAFASAGTQQHAWRFQLSHQDVGNRRTGAGTVAPSGYEARAAAFSWRQRIGQSSELSLDLQHLRQPSTPRVDELVAGFGQTGASSSEFFFEPNSRDFAHLKWSGDSENRWFSEYELHLAAQRVTDDRRSRDFGLPQRTLENNASTLYGLTGQFRKGLTELTDLVYGFEGYDDRVSSRRELEDVQSGERVGAMARFPDGSRIRSSAVYAHVDSSLGERLALEAGLRYSRFDIDLAAADRPLGAELNLDKVTASIAARYALTENISLVANLGQGFRAPNIFDLGTLGPRPGNRFNIANPDLGPERVLSLDVGLKWSGERWRGELVAFALDYEDQITSVLTGNITPEGRLEVISDNVNEVTLTGLELAMGFQFSDQLSGAMQLNTIRGEERDALGQSTDADRVPPANAEVSLNWQLNDAWQFGVVGRMARRQDRLSSRDIRDPRISPAGTPGWGTIDLRAAWEPDDDLALDLTLHNLADRQYREHGSGIDAPGRGVVLSVRKTF
ncbi:MAG: TonB-dependent receptor plug domain-containing protein [Lysobacterales bacterium]